MVVPGEGLVKWPWGSGDTIGWFFFVISGGHFPWRCVGLRKGNSHRVEIPKTRFTVRSVDVTIDWPDVSQAARQIWNIVLATKNDDPSWLRNPKIWGNPIWRDEPNLDIIDFRFHKMAFLFRDRECYFWYKESHGKKHGSWIEAFVFFIEHVHSLKLTSRPPKHGGWETIFLLGPSAYFQGRTVREDMFCSPLPAMLLCWEWNYDYLMKPRRGLRYDCRLIHGDTPWYIWLSKHPNKFKLVILGGPWPNKHLSGCLSGEVGGGW